MDTKKDILIPKPVPDLTGCKIVVGTKQLRKALLQGRAQQVYLASNADPGLTEPLEALCRQYHIPCSWVPSMTELGCACGIEVGAAAAAVVTHLGSYGSSV